MTTTALPDRGARTGGRWSSPELLDDLLLLATIERGVAHVIAGWVPKVHDLDDKLRLASSLETSMSRAAALRQHALTLLERDAAGLTASRTWVEPLRELDADRDAIRVVDALLDDVGGWLLAHYHELLDRVDPLYDARLIVTLKAALETLGSERSSDAEVPAPTTRQLWLTDALDGAWRDRRSPRVPLAEVLWAPLDRVPFPARPLDRVRPEAGALGFYVKDSRTTEREIAGELNSNVLAELAALELMCRCSYEHPELPWSFHTSVARHATDEARHAAMFRRLLSTRGFSEHDLPQYGTNYELGYEFPECEPGGQRELVWRLLILCTVLEGLALDRMPVEIATRDWLDQPDIARALDYIAADELFHVENGLQWTRRLCDELNLDPILERELVHGRFFGRQRDVRVRYLEADPERAAREIELLDAPDPDAIPFVPRTEVELRRRASFTDAECEQVDRWGYNGAVPREFCSFG